MGALPSGDHCEPKTIRSADVSTYCADSLISAVICAIGTLGHSQGGMVARWSLRFWPDTRHMVDDVIGMAPSNHGTAAAHATCVTPCSPAIW